MSKCQLSSRRSREDREQNHTQSPNKINSLDLLLSYNKKNIIIKNYFGSTGALDRVMLSASNTDKKNTKKNNTDKKKPTAKFITAKVIS